MNAPKEIWIPDPANYSPWYPQKPEGESVEYIRSDLIPRWVSGEIPPRDEGEEFFVLYEIKDGGGQGFMGTAEFAQGQWFTPTAHMKVMYWLENAPPYP